MKNHCDMKKYIYRFVAGAAICALCACVGPAKTAEMEEDRKGKSICDAGLRDTIASIVAEYPAEIGVALITDSGDTLTVADKPVYPMMSVFKLHQAVAVCEVLDSKGISLDSVIAFNRAGLDPATWSLMLKEYHEEQMHMSVGDLLRYALMQSDNNASNLLFERIVPAGQTDSIIARIIPRGSFRIAFTEGEMSLDHSRAYANVTSPLGAAILIDRLYADSLISSGKQQFIREALQNCKTGVDRISAPLAAEPGVVVGHKTGSGYVRDDGVLVAHNDVAHIILPSGRSYSLAVLVKDIKGDGAMASEAIARISEVVYQMITDK